MTERRDVTAIPDNSETDLQRLRAENSGLRGPWPSSCASGSSSWKRAWTRTSTTLARRPPRICRSRNRGPARSANRAGV